MDGPIIAQEIMEAKPSKDVPRIFFMTTGHEQRALCIGGGGVGGVVGVSHFLMIFSLPIQ